MTPYYADESVTLYHGNAEDVLAELPSATADVVLTDPPYGMNYKSGWSGANVAMDGTRNALRMYRRLLPELVRVMADDAHLYWFTRWDVFADATDALSPYLPVVNMLVWDKGHPGMGNLTLYGYSHELILFAVKGKRGLVGGRPGNVFRTNPVPVGRRIHPTEKPLGLLRQLIVPSAATSVLDLFAGSGSTLIAAKEAGATAIGIELEERYCEAAALRLQQAATQGELFGGAA